MEHMISNDVLIDLEHEAIQDMEEKSKKITVPKVQSMDFYILQHYRTELLAEVNDKLASGEISRMVEMPIISEIVKKEDFHIINISYWRINRSDFYADVSTQIELTVEMNGIDVKEAFFFYFTIWFSFLEDIQYELREFGLHSDKPKREEIMLDQYLIPIFSTEGIEQSADEIWEKYCPDALTDCHLRNPFSLAQKYGLKTESLRLYQSNHVKAILFMEEGTVLVQDTQPEGVSEPIPPKLYTVSPDTIVLNTAAKQPEVDLDIYHECYHYEWHYLFFRLQEMCNSDLRQLPRKEVEEKKDKKTKDPTSYLEAQARRGSIALMMPLGTMKKKIWREFQRASIPSRVREYFNHDGWRYETVARTIAKEYQLKKYLVRKRLIMMGYIAAKGALNYVDGRYIDAFAFSHDHSANGNDTYVINRKNTDLLYRNNKEFQKLMSTGDYAFVDGHICFNDTDYVRMTTDGARLTPWANAHVDQCCLRFETKYIEEHTPCYHFGEAHSDEDNNHYNEYLDKNASMTDKERMEARGKIIMDMPLNFNEALVYIMKDHGSGKTTIENLAAVLGVSERTIIRLRQEERTNYSTDLIIGLCVAMHLPPWLSRPFIQRANITVSSYGKSGYYGTILDCYYMDTIATVQEFLEKNGYHKLVLEE